MLKRVFSRVKSADTPVNLIVAKVFVVVCVLKYGNGHIGTRESGHCWTIMFHAARCCPSGSFNERMVCGSTVSRRTNSGTDSGKEI